ncbi:uncharacterized protein B0I36DRAFT_342267 [Microdochium trichocladiopsis]|uniref:Uncharacterized protein n=1 Tax=Microdochium trichocladiopsis TaxID=1682393 RepID=A0A9P8XSR5_9PEZI|nr:uncharacterized protein B0I36DRAFT_342267 [Microdochium trichocladiopsis]KAH7009402.1 hypothetical protein B0I36DRAFT_342267 [Microdochium trichocladiopsis]
MMSETVRALQESLRKQLTSDPLRAQAPPNFDRNLQDLDPTDNIILQAGADLSTWFAIFTIRSEDRDQEFPDRFGSLSTEELHLLVQSTKKITPCENYQQRIKAIFFDNKNKSKDRRTQMTRGGWTGEAAPDGLSLPNGPWERAAVVTPLPNNPDSPPTDRRSTTADSSMPASTRPQCDLNPSGPAPKRQRVDSNRVTDPSGTSSVDCNQEQAQYGWSLQSNNKPVYRENLVSVFPEFTVESIVSDGAHASVRFDFPVDPNSRPSFMLIDIKYDRVHIFAEKLCGTTIIEKEDRRGVKKRYTVDIRRSTWTRIDGTVTLGPARQRCVEELLGSISFLAFRHSPVSQREDRGKETTGCVELIIPGDPKAPGTVQLLGADTNLSEMANSLTTVP